MTIILVLGLFAGLYLLWLLFSLATLATPLYVGMAVGLWLLHHDHGYPGSIVAGFLAGVITLIVGQFLFGWIQSPIPRLAIAALFVIPAGIAGFNAVHGLAGLAMTHGVWLTVISLAGGAAIAGSAWTRLVSPA